MPRHPSCAQEGTEAQGPSTKPGNQSQTGRQRWARQRQIMELAVVPGRAARDHPRGVQAGKIVALRPHCKDRIPPTHTGQETTTDQGATTSWRLVEGLRPTHLPRIRPPQAHRWC
ncbi:hypothetical protein FKM82_017290 [Ascaphus truei]